jgi:hypothetical protein
MIDLLPTFFAASAVVVSASGASGSALLKITCLRMFLFKDHRLPLRLLIGIAFTETIIMFISLALAFKMVEPYATPQLGSKTMFFIALFSAATVIHIAVVWLPNYFLVSSRSIEASRSDEMTADLIWAGVLATMTPCSVSLIAIWLWLFVGRY